MKLPEQQHTTAAAVIKWYASKKQAHRPHLGASILGHKCKRYIWQTWRWVATPTFPPRILRLFDSGVREESRFISELRSIGAEVWDVDPATGEQWSVTFANGHGGGHLDGVAQGLPESPKTAAVLEFKTHGDKSFVELVKLGVRGAKPQHFDQMTIYMGLMSLDRALYMACNKNTDDIYTEWVHFDRERFDVLMALADEIVAMPEPPAKLSEDPAHWECKFCTFNAQCHQQKVAEVNCRTCCHASPVAAGKWACEMKQPEIEKQEGCKQHLMLPALVPFAKPIDGGEAWVMYEMAEGVRFTNGPDGTSVGAPNYSSAELQHAPAALIGDMKIVKEQIPTARAVSASAFDDMESDDLDKVPVKNESAAARKTRTRNAAAVAALKEFKA